MHLQPKQVRWFEAQVPRDQSVLALETLAGSIELEDRGFHAAPCVDTEVLHRQLARIDQLKSRHGADLPPADATPTKNLERPERLAEAALAKIQEWCGGLLEIQRRLRQLENEKNRLDLIAECLAAMGKDARGLDAMGHSSGLLFKHIFACPLDQIGPSDLSSDVFAEVYRGDSHAFWILVGAPERQTVLEGAAALLHCTPLDMPAWLPADPPAQQRELALRLRTLADQQRELRALLSSHRADKEVRTALANARLLHWYLSVAIDLTPDRSACHLAGWTTAANPEALEQRLAAAGIQASVIFGTPRADLKPPVAMDTAAWSQPFRLFVELIGTPGHNEIDPTPLLALMVPLLFGFMFADLGHGLVLAVAGAIMARRRPAAVILIHCGLAAAGFGLVFGETFGIHGLLPSPCGCPLEYPVEILVVTLVLGVGLILLGLVFSGIEARWRGETGRWLLEEAPLVVLYLSAALSLLVPEAWIGSVAGATWYLIGVGILCRHAGAGCLLGRIGRLIESSFQLVVATLSFMRVGAFALAHAAFSAVVLELGEQIDPPLLKGLVLVLGHLTIIVVEGLIVMVQTTRLVLFEFFTRFLRFEGRIYKPLQKPGAD